MRFSGKFKLEKDKDGRYFIDRDSAAFCVVLNFLRTGRVHYGALDPDFVNHEASYYGVPLDDTLDPSIDAEMVDNLDLQGEKNIVSVLRKATLSSWRDYSVKSIKKMMPKLVGQLTYMVKQQGGFGATIAFYQNAKKKDTIATSWEREGIKAEVSWYDVIIYLERVEQPLIEMWAAYLKTQGFVDISYAKRAHPVLHWCLILTWNASKMEDHRSPKELLRHPVPTTSQ